MIHSPKPGDVVKIAPVYGFYAGRRIINKQQPYVKVDGWGALPHNDTSAMNLIIKDYSDDVARVFAWVDNDDKSSWAFEKVPENDKYTKLYKGTNKYINVRNGGEPFSTGATYKITVRGYDNNRKIICTETISLKVPNAITNSSAKPVLSGSFTVTSLTVARDYPRQNGSVTRNLKKGDKVDVYAEYGNWYLVARGTPQWVEKQYLTR